MVIIEEIKKKKKNGAHICTTYSNNNYYYYYYILFFLLRARIYRHISTYVYRSIILRQRLYPSNICLSIRFPFSRGSSSNYDTSEMDEKNIFFRTRNSSVPSRNLIKASSRATIKSSIKRGKKKRRKKLL